MLLLEAGGGDGNPLITMPKGIAVILGSPRWTWRFPVTQPRARRCRANEVWVRGRVIGGGGSVNGMIYSRGHPLDYDDWERLGGAGWGWDEMLAAYRAIEDHELGANEHRGAGGPLRVAAGPFRYPLAEALIEAGTQARPPPPGGPEPPRSRRHRLLRPHGPARPPRESAATAFLDPVRKRPNLVVRTGALVERVLFEGGRADRCGRDRRRRAGDLRRCPGGRALRRLGDVAEAARAVRRRRRRPPPAARHPRGAPQPARRRAHAGPPHLLDAAPAASAPRASTAASGASVACPTSSATS